MNQKAEGGAGREAWRAWPREELEREYSPSSLAGPIEPYVAEYRRRSREAEQKLDYMKDLPYGGDGETLDLFPAGDDARAPLLVYIHGGYWQDLSKADSLFAAEDCVANGIAFAAIEYTLAPAATVEQIVKQCERAVLYLREAAEDLGFDRERIFLAGQSAGAHLAAMVGAHGETAKAVAGAVLTSGIYDLRPLVGTYINEPLHLDEREAARMSPALMQVEARPEQWVVAWGGRDTDEFKRQSMDYAAQLVGAGVECVTVEEGERNHFDLVFDLVKAGTPLGDAVLEMIREQW
jgi:arylformamidase